MKISFINQIAQICKRLGVDVQEVAAGMGYDKRIRRAFTTRAIASQGGKCFTEVVLTSPSLEPFGSDATHFAICL